MNLPISPPVEPMLAKLSDELPEGEGWIYEPKWDGFRVIVFRDRDEWQLQSRDLKPLDRYFPELAAPILAQLPERCVLDGEVVVAQDGSLDFEALGQRIHPAVKRIQLLAEATPASLVFWDVLALGDEDLCQRPFAERRARLEAALAHIEPPIHVTPVTRDRDRAEDWFRRFEGAGLDGVMAKRDDDPYQPKKRAMLKIKHSRTADCVLAGFRWHKNGPGTHVGSLLLGLHDEAGRLHFVGSASSFSTRQRAALAEELAPWRENAAEGHPWLADPSENQGVRLPNAESRWSKGKLRDWEPLRPERVLEVAFDHMEGARFRHTTQLVRWRPDKTPRECGFDQLEVTPAYELAQIFGGG